MIDIGTSKYMYCGSTDKVYTYNREGLNELYRDLHHLSDYYGHATAWQAHTYITGVFEKLIFGDDPEVLKVLYGQSQR